MTLFPVALALALETATPEWMEGLEQRAPQAAQTLQTCQAQGCAPAQAAEAAWILALYTWLDTGYADPALAGTVAELDPALFGDLPPVLQQSAGQALAIAPPPPVAQVEPAPLPLPEPPSEPAALLTAAPPEGLYQSWASVLAGTPDVLLPDDVGLNYHKAFTMIGKNPDAVRLDGKRKREKELGPILALSDGETLFVTMDMSLQPAQMAQLVPVELGGRYGHVLAVDVAVTRNADGTLTQWPYTQPKVLDLSTGNLQMLERRFVRSLLSDDPDLLAEFEAESRKGRLLKEYVQRWEQAQ